MFASLPPIRSKPPENSHVQTNDTALDAWQPPPSTDKALDRLADELLQTYHRAGLYRPPATYELIYHYPPAQTFIEANPRDVAHALEATPIRDLLLYVHIPFATTRCTFCHYVCQPTPSSEVLQEYLQSLNNEMRAYANIPSICQSVVRAVHVGGGTPTTLPKSLLQNLFTMLREYFNLSSVQEICVEASPETIADRVDLLEMLRAAGVTRLSIGLQSLNDKILAGTNRAHDAATGTWAVHAAAQAGFPHLNVDLIYGLPGQTYKSWERTLGNVIVLPVNSLCVYQCRYAPSGLAIRSEREFSERDLLKMCLLAQNELLRAGFRPVQPNQWVRGGGVFHRYVEGKWRDDLPTLGLGQSAYSSFSFGTYVNTRDSGTYHTTLRKPSRESRFPVARVGWLDTHRHLAQRAVLGWRALCTPLDFSVLRKQFPDCSSQIDRYQERVEALAELRLFERTTEGYCARPSAIPRADEISVFFYDPRDNYNLIERNAGAYGAYLHRPLATIDTGSSGVPRSRGI